MKADPTRDQLEMVLTLRNHENCCYIIYSFIQNSNLHTNKQDCYEISLICINTYWSSDTLIKLKLLLKE